MMENNSYKQSLTLKDATLLVAGSMIGSGIFIVSADIVRNVGTANNLLLVWLVTGLMTSMAAISYGELSGMFPKAGGQYIYLKEAFHPLPAFLYGWSFFTVIQTGTIAAVGVAFAKFTAYLLPVFSEEHLLFESSYVSISAAQLLSISSIIFLSYIHTKGIEGGKKIQTSLTSIKIFSLLALILFGLLWGKTEVWQSNQHTFGRVIDKDFTLYLSAFSAAMVGAIFSSDAWNSVTFIAGEIKNPQQNIGLALLLGTTLVTLLYLLTNVMYLYVLPLGEIAGAEKDRVGIAASQVIFGESGTVLMAILIMISTFGCNNGLIIAGARVGQAMAKDKLFFNKAASLNKHNVPANALWLQALLASIWCLSGKYGNLLDMVSFVVVLFYILTVYGIFRLRKTQPHITRPYKVFGYPLIPAAYMLMGSTFCISLIIYKPDYTWPGLIITLLGIPAYLLFSRKKNHTPAVEPTNNIQSDQ